jgi:hypothetical protein
VAATRHTIRDGDRDMLVAYVLPTLDEIAASGPENEDGYVRPLLHNSAVLLKSLGLPAVPFHKYRAADKVQRFVGREWLGGPIRRTAHLLPSVLYSEVWKDYSFLRLRVRFWILHYAPSAPVCMRGNVEGR